MTRALLLAVCLLGLATSGCRKKAEPTVAGEPGAAAPPATSGDAAPAQPEGAAPARVGNPADPAKPPDAAAEHPDLAATSADFEAWFKKYHLDLNDPKMLDADPDGDGFTNREEFLAGTDPLDPNSHPGVHSGMKMKEYTKVELPFILRSVEGETAQIERTDGGEKRVEAVKAGQPLKNSNFRVTKVQSRSAFDKDGHPVDASHVELEDASSHKKLDLVKDLPTRSSSSYAVLTSPDGTQTMSVHQGDTFAWPNEPATKYVVKDLRDEQVILEQQDTKQTWTVRKP